MTEDLFIEDYLNKGLEKLRAKNDEVPCRENSMAITKIEEALMWLEHRQRDRESRGVVGTKRM